MDSAITLLVVTTTCAGVAIGGTFFYRFKIRSGDHGMDDHQEETYSHSHVLPGQGTTPVKQTGNKTSPGNENTLGKKNTGDDPSPVRRNTGDDKRSNEGNAGNDKQSNEGNEGDKYNQSNEGDKSNESDQNAAPVVTLHPPKFTPETLQSLPIGIQNKINPYIDETLPRVNSSYDKTIVKGIINMYMMTDGNGGWQPRKLIPKNTRTQLAVALVWRTYHDTNKDISLTRSKCIELLRQFDTDYILDPTLLAAAKTTLKDLEKVIDYILMGKEFK
jgi:hypothetical protein